MPDFVYKALVKVIDLYTRIRDRVNPEWSIRNSPRIREWKLMAYTYSRSPIGLVGGSLVLLFAIIAIIGPALAWQPYWEYKVVENPDLWLSPPCFPPSCSGFPLLGTDEWGRDVFAMIFYGVRISFVISLLIVLIGAPVGIVLGLVAGYKGGVVDEILMRITDMFVAFPGLVLAIAFATVLPQRIRGLLEANVQLRDFLLFLFGLRPEEYGQLASLLSVLLALVIVWWPIYARTVRGSVLSIREQVFVEAARSIGLSTWKILVRHILPNVLSPIIVMMTFDLATAALLSASLSFLGLGPQDPVPELGFMISKAGQYFPERSWHIVVFDGIVLLLIAFGWNLLGDSLRDVLDPKTRRSIEVRLRAKKAGKGGKSD
ncbi:MAG: ABC transporter permease [Thermoprotei archaeon]|nr:MAG: ABC transporter permease [Thermoprotei archaeon]